MPACDKNGVVLGS